MCNGVAAQAYDYTDSFTAHLAAEDTRTPEQLARAVFEGAPRPVRGFLLAGFRFGLGLRLAHGRSAEHVFGWRIVDAGPLSITLQASSWLLTSRLLLRIEGSRVSQSTLVCFEKPIAALIWPPVAVLHRQIVPRLLRRAVAGFRACDTRDAQGAVTAQVPRL